MAYHDSYPDFWDFLDDRTYTLDGVHGKFKISSNRAIYPYPHVSFSLYHEPSAKGKRSKAYKDEKRMLGDDWSTDLSDSERATDIALKLGIENDPDYEHIFKSNPSRGTYAKPKFRYESIFSVRGQPYRVFANESQVGRVDKMADGTWIARTLKGKQLEDFRTRGAASQALYMESGL